MASRCAPRKKAISHTQMREDLLQYDLWFQTASGTLTEYSQKRTLNSPVEGSATSRKAQKTAPGQSPSGSSSIHANELMGYEGDAAPGHEDPEAGNSNSSADPPASPSVSTSPGATEASSDQNRAQEQQPRGSFQPDPVDMSSEDADSSTARIHIPDLKTTDQFIQALKNANLDESNMNPDDIASLRFPEPGGRAFDPSDIHTIKAIRTFMATQLSSRQTYDDLRKIHMETYPDDPYLSYNQVKRLLGRITGVNSIYHDMCEDSCVAFTGPYSHLEACPICSKPRYQMNDGAKKARQFMTIPLGPVLQSFFGSIETATQMHYLEERLEEIWKYIEAHDGQIPTYDDTACGRDLLDAWSSGKFRKGDIALQLTTDGAQLYRSKQSDCWFFFWIIHSLPPSLRYKKAFVIPAGFVPGPNAPKDLDSFMFPSLHHVSSLQREGFSYWDASVNCIIKESKLLVIFFSADGPAAAAASGRVGHGGKHGCRVNCALPSRHRTGDGHYFPAMLKPLDYNVHGCSHDDVTIAKLAEFRSKVPQQYRKNLTYLLGAKNKTQYNKRRLETGICKQTILDGIETLGVPNIFTMDLMHLSALNDPELLLGLWRCDKQRVKCYAPDTIDDWDWGVLRSKIIWEAHGKTVVNAVSYIPSSFGRSPRDPAEKLNSGYKAWEFVIWLLGLGPTLLRHILPEKYWSHFCKLVAGIQIFQRHSISITDLQRGAKLLNDFVLEFEELYCQRKESRLHFARQSIHTLTHIAPETKRAGPLACYAQWATETAIGNLGNEIRQDRDPFANLEQRGLLRAQANSLQARYPQIKLDSNEAQPILARTFDGGYTMLPTAETTRRPLPQDEYLVLMDYWSAQGWPNRESWANSISRWARLRLPNGQTARSIWYESRATCKLRKASCVEIDLNGQMRIADIHFFFYLRFDEDHYPLALVTLFSLPDDEIPTQQAQITLGSLDDGTSLPDSARVTSAIQNATGEMLTALNNTAYMRLNLRLERQSLEIERLKTENVKLELAIAGLQAQVKVFSEVNEKLSQQRLTTGDSRPSLPPPKSRPPPLDQAEYIGRVKFWDRSAYRTFNKSKRGESDGNATAQKKRGGRRDALKLAADAATADQPNTTHVYLETEDGIPISWAQLATLSQHARDLWKTALEAGRAPATWGEASSSLKAFYYTHLLSVPGLEFLKLCNGDWKLEHWTVLNYASWASAHDLTKSKQAKKDHPDPGTSTTKDLQNIIEDPDLIHMDNNNDDDDSHDVDPPAPSTDATSSRDARIQPRTGQQIRDPLEDDWDLEEPEPQMSDAEDTGSTASAASVTGATTTSNTPTTTNTTGGTSAASTSPPTTTTHTSSSGSLSLDDARGKKRTQEESGANESSQNLDTTSPRNPEGLTRLDSEPTSQPAAKRRRTRGDTTTSGVGSAASTSKPAPKTDKAKGRVWWQQENPDGSEKEFEAYWKRLKPAEKKDVATKGTSIISAPKTPTAVNSM